MKIAYLDCGAGVSGNMLVGALVGLGLPPDFLLSELRKLPIELPELTFNTVKRQGIQANFFEVVDKQHEHHHRHLADQWRRPHQ